MGVFPQPGNATGSGDGPLEDLCRRIESFTEEEGALIRKTLHSLIVSGYIKMEVKEGKSRWYWTHNRHIDRMSTTPKSTACGAAAPEQFVA
jgi:hypothetical protein